MRNWRKKREKRNCLEFKAVLIRRFFANISSKSRYNPRVFTEQGLYYWKSSPYRTTRGYVTFNSDNKKYCSVDIAYTSIYSQAKHSVYLIDNYIGTGKIHNIEYNDFCREYPGIQLTMQHTDGVFHDRFIVLDYGTKDERVFLCGASSRDAGARITSIVEDFGTKKYDPVVKKLLRNEALQLP